MASELFKKAISRIDPKDRERTIMLFRILSRLKAGDKYFKAKEDIIWELIKEPKAAFRDFYLQKAVAKSVVHFLNHAVYQLHIIVKLLLTIQLKWQLLL